MRTSQPYRSFAFSIKTVSAYLFVATLYGITLWLLGSEGVMPGAALAAPLVWLSVEDLRRYELPDIGTLAVTLIGTANAAGQDVFIEHLATGTVITGVLWSAGEIYFRWAKKEGLGIGDAKLFGAGAVVLGPWHLPEMFLLAATGGIIGYLLSLGARNKNAIPFGPYIAYSVFILSFLEPMFL